MIIGTNVMSLKTRYFLGNTNNKMETAMERLSSGKRINSAKDDAAGTGIAARMEGQIRGMNVASRNALDGISLLETAEASLGNAGSILQRMRELSVQADNGTYSADDKASLQKEFSQLISEVGHISTTASFNGIPLLNGTQATVELHISDQASDVMAVDMVDLAAVNTAISTLDISTAAGAKAAITALDTQIDTITSGRADLGSSMNRLQFTIDNLTTMSNNLSAAKSRIEDADMAAEVSEMTKQKILMQSSTSMLVQANQNPQAVLQLLQ